MVSEGCFRAVSHRRGTDTPPKFEFRQFPTAGLKFRLAHLTPNQANLLDRSVASVRETLPTNHIGGPLRRARGQPTNATGLISKAGQAGFPIHGQQPAGGAQEGEEEEEGAADGGREGRRGGAGRPFAEAGVQTTLRRSPTCGRSRVGPAQRSAALGVPEIPLNCGLNCGDSAHGPGAR